MCLECVVCFNGQCVYSVMFVLVTSVFTVCCLFQQPASSQCVVCFSNQCVHVVLSVSATSMFTACCLFQQPASSQCVVCFSNQHVHSLLSVSATGVLTVCCLFQQPACSQCTRLVPRRAGCSSCTTPSTVCRHGKPTCISSLSSSFWPGW